MSKVIFESGAEGDSGEGESVLRQWETMHRPPDTIPTSGPQYGHKFATSGTTSTQIGLIVPPPTSHSKSRSRRHSVISSPKTILLNFLLGQMAAEHQKVRMTCEEYQKFFSVRIILW